MTAEQLAELRTLIEKRATCPCECCATLREIGPDLLAAAEENAKLRAELSRIEHLLNDPEKTCGELSCDECNERFGAAKARIADLRAEVERLTKEWEGAIEETNTIHVNILNGADRRIADLEAELANTAADLATFNAMRAEVERWKSLQESTQAGWAEDLDKGEQRIADLEAQLAAARAERDRTAAVVGELQKEIDGLKVELAMYRDKARGDYWVWQGDGGDHLESLSCPVLIRPKKLMEIIAASKDEEDDDKDVIKECTSCRHTEFSKKEVCNHCGHDSWTNRAFWDSPQGQKIIAASRAAKPLTADEILAKATGAFNFDRIDIDKGVVGFCQDFTYDSDTEEPHDAAWDVQYDIAEALKTVGLRSPDMESDNDSVFGTIVEIAPEKG